MKLKHTFEYLSLSGLRTCLEIEVDFDHNDGIDVISIIAYDYSTNPMKVHDSVNLTDLYEQNNLVDDLLDKVDWHELAAETLAARQESLNESFAE